MAGAVTLSPPALRLHNLSKSFGGEQALKHASLSVAPGEVHGLLGQNGSGKSTLIKILAGFHAPDPGAELSIHGSPVALPLKAGEFRRHGLSFVHQNLGLVPSLTVVENLFVGELASIGRWWISWATERRRAAAIFARYGLRIDPAQTVGRLPAVQRALLALIRAVEEIRPTVAGESGGGVLVLDEPTPFLPRRDVEQLFSLIKMIVANGASVIFVSHDIDEVLEITDRATVLRDGQVVGRLETANASKQDFVELIVGRKFAPTTARPQSPESKSTQSGLPDVVIDGLTGSTLHGVSIALHAGEIVGLTGLIGSGFNEVPYLLFGAQAARSGRLRLRGSDYDLTSLDPARAITRDIVLIPADRQAEGAVASLTVADNVTMPVLSTVYNPWKLNRRGMLNRVLSLQDAFDVRPNQPSLQFDALSGGNQQKALLAKWLQSDPALILLDEPTQGVDVGARQRIFDAIKTTAANGAAVLCASSDYEQLAAICDRVLIFSQGAIAAELTGDAVTKETIAERCYHSASSQLAAVPLDEFDERI